jgi:hypothetical protein
VRAASGLDAARRKGRRLSSGDGNDEEGGALRVDVEGDVDEARLRDAAGGTVAHRDVGGGGQRRLLAVDGRGVSLTYTRPRV